MHEQLMNGAWRLANLIYFIVIGIAKNVVVRIRCND
jgi:hypothetical protein